MNTQELWTRIDALRLACPNDGECELFGDNCELCEQASDIRENIVRPMLDELIASRKNG